MSGPEMEEAVAANSLSLEPRAPATPDREAIWYPGRTQVLASDGDIGSLSGRHTRSRRQPKSKKDPVEPNPHGGVFRKKKPITLDIAQHSAYGPWRLVTLYFLRVSIGSGAVLAPLSPARNPTGPPN